MSHSIILPYYQRAPWKVLPLINPSNHSIRWRWAGRQAISRSSLMCFLTENGKNKNDVIVHGQNIYYHHHFRFPPPGSLSVCRQTCRRARISSMTHRMLILISTQQERALSQQQQQPWPSNAIHLNFQPFIFLLSEPLIHSSTTTTMPISTRKNHTPPPPLSL